MKHPNGHRGEGTEPRDSSRVGLSPYFIEDIGLTARELAQTRRADTWIVTPR